MKQQPSNRIAVLAATWTLALAAILAPAVAQAADSSWRRMAMVVFENYDHLMSDVGNLGTLLENPALNGANLEAMINLMTQGKGLNGLDKSRPWGLVAMTDGAQFRAVAFLPVTSLDQLLESVGPIAGQVKPAGADGVIEISRPELSLFVKESNGWAYIAQASEELDPLPIDPTKVATQLAKAYDIAIYLDVKKIPKPLRERAMGMLADGVKQNVLHMPPGGPPGAEPGAVPGGGAVPGASAGPGDREVKQLGAAIDALDHATIGLAIDEKANLALEVKVVAVADSILIKAFEHFDGVVTSLGGVALPTSMVDIHFASKYLDNEKPGYQEVMNIMRDGAHAEVDLLLTDKAAQKAAKQLATELAEVANKTIAAGKRDLALTAVPGDTMSVVAGTVVADPKAVELSLKKFAAAMAKSYPSAPKPKFNADKVGEVRIHTITLPTEMCSPLFSVLVVPVSTPDLEELFGKNLDIAVGVGPKHVYVGLGKDGLESIKSCLGGETSSANAPRPLDAVAKAKPLIKFIASRKNPDPNQQAMLAFVAGAAEKLGDEDRLRISAEASRDRATLRLDLGRDVLRILGGMLAPPGMGGPNGPTGMPNPGAMPAGAAQ